MAPRFTLINAGAFCCPLLGYLYPHKIFKLCYELSSDWHVIKLQGFWHQTLSTKGMLKLVAVDILGTECMLVLVVV